MNAQADYTITISKNGQGQWVVSEPAPVVSKTAPAKTNPRMNDVIQWQFDENFRNNSVTAHIQFTSLGLFKNPPTVHETATVMPGQPLQLTVKEANDQKREKDPSKHGRHYYYAVWVVESNGAGSYAISHNPPPEISIGP